MSETDKRERTRADWIGTAPGTVVANDVDLGLWLSGSSGRKAFAAPRTGLLDAGPQVGADASTEVRTEPSLR